MPTIKQDSDFPNANAHASAPYANQADGNIFAYAVAGTTDPSSVSDAFQAFRASCLSGVWGNIFLNGLICPNAVILFSGVILNGSVYIVWMIFADKPSATFTPIK